MGIRSSTSCRSRFIITAVETNVVRGRSISASFADPTDPALKLARRAGLLPWEVAPY